MHEQAPQLPSQIQSVTALGQYQFVLLGEQSQMCADHLPGVAA